MNYIIFPKLVKMGVESKVSCKDTSTTKFCKTFSDVMDDVKAVFPAAPPSKL
jgi:hypothetical protein